MSRPSNSDKMAKLHSDAMAEFDRIQSAMRDERLQCLQDRRFYSIAGAQWEGPLGEQFENKPRFEVNKIHLAVIRIINEYRNNRVTVDFISKEGAEYDKLADACDSLYRADEQDSTASEAYDNAFEEAVSGGFGAWRLRTCYENEEDDEDERQRIRIEPIYDADSSVFFDLNAKRQDKSDARSCFVLTAMTRDAYEDEYDDDPSSWPKLIHQHEFDWYTPDVVYVAEYYRVEEKSEVVRVFVDMNDEETRYRESDFENDDMLEETLTATGQREVRQKKIKVKKVHKYILSGGKVLEDCGYIAGKHIPIVPVYGKRWFIDNVERCMGHVRLAKDAQRLKNMQLSKLGEISALSSVEKPILVPEQIAGHQIMWAEDNVKDYPYRLINPVTGVDGNMTPMGPVDYTRSPQVPPAMAALLQLTEQDMKDLLGNQEQADKIISNISGKAVEMIQQRLDMQTYIYMSNFAKGMQRCGQIWLGMARDVYVEPKRKMKAVAPNNEVGAVELMKPIFNDEGELDYENDLSEADFDVVSEVGPSSASQRQATVRAIAGMLAVTQDPETAAILTAVGMMNMEGEGLSDVNAYFRRKLIRMGAVKPTEKEQQELQAEMQNQQPDPQAVYLQAAAAEASAKAEQAKATTVKTIADSELIRAKTAETLSGIDESARRLSMDSFNLANTAVQKDVKAQQDAIKLMLEQQQMEQSQQIPQEPIA